MRKFKTESQKILDIMINSIYTNKEIFLRELISNASDAIDKLYYKSLTQNIGGLTRDDFAIRLTVDEAARTLTVSDNGIGMTADELDSNLGVIARSGSQEFKAAAEQSDGIDIIGQFGVGFYSSFMVAKKVRVLTKKYGEDEAHVWVSNGVEGYDIKPSTKEEHGTEITLYLKDDTDEEEYSDYLTEYKLRELVKKYSNYIRYPIKMMVTCYRSGEEGKEEEYQEEQTVNSQVPLWVKNKNEVSEEEYDTFYRTNFYDSDKPLLTIHTRVEGKVDYKALLFVPARAPYDYYSKTYEKGLKLYTSGVMISEKCADLLPDCFSFVRGLVDSDLSLNISRETIQQNHQLRAIADNLKSKIQKELLALQKSDRAKYEDFYKAFGLQLKYGIYAEWGMNKDLLQDLLLFRSVKEDKQVTLKEYVEAAPEGQPAIYYGIARNVAAVRSMPQSESLLAKGYDILCFDTDIDEFAARVLREYDKKEFKNIADEAVAEEDAAKGDQTRQDVLDFVQEQLGDKVGKVKGTTRFKTHAVCLSASGDVSLEMERVINSMPNAEGGVKANRVLEINTEHPAFAKLCALYDTDLESAKDLVDVLYDQACMVAGLAIEDAAAYVAKVTALLTK